MPDSNRGIGGVGGGHPISAPQVAALGMISGVITGGTITINSGDAAKIDVAAGTGIIINHSTPGTPVYTEVSWVAKIAVVVTNLGTQTFTNFYIDTAGDLQQVGGASLTPAQRRQFIALDGASHPNLTAVTSISVNGALAYEGINACIDYIDALGPLNGGNVYSENGTDLKVQKAVGTTHLPWINKNNDPQNPTEVTNPVQSPLSPWLASHRDGSGGFTLLFGVTATSPDLYDSGTGTLVAVANNKWQIKRFYFFGQVDATVEVYGQATYASMSEAETAIFTESPIVDPNFVAGTFVTALIIKKGATDLSDDAEAKFVDIVNSTTVAGSGATDMQGAYDNSIDPEILTDSTRGALSIKRGSSADTDNVIEVLNGAGTTVFQVTGEGKVIAAVGTAGVIGIALGDETTDIETGTATVTFRMPHAFTLTDIRLSAVTAPTGSGVTVDVNEAGSTILSTKLTLDATEKTSETAATPAVISDSALADDAEITVDIDAIGSTIAGAGLKLWLIGSPA